MVKKAVIDLPLHEGKAPRWLYDRMVRLAEPIISMMADEHGPTGLLERISDPLWFQALSCALGYDWDSSGTTTVTCAALKKALSRVDVGVKACGGKGRASRLTVQEVPYVCELYGFECAAPSLIRVSRLVAKVDTAAVQAGYNLYHQTLFIAEDGSWSVVQQGMRADGGYARRFHWLSLDVRDFVEEPHKGIVGDAVHRNVLNLVDKDSREARRACVDIAVEGPERAKRLFREAFSKLKGPLDLWIDRQSTVEVEEHRIPRFVNWQALERALEVGASSFEELLLVEGMGPLTIRSLALIAELIFGAKLSWRDPVKYAFAFGGKDGVPHPVDVKRMEEAISFLSQAVEEARLDHGEKLAALRRLSKLLR
ncbi:MAG: DUF763 domain-containing protein [Candidatus Nezhaarchaeota archaeon]|nr:DUF763 domain-containing protein [Candidatus Nezhaarchaeota archaeon]